MKKILLGCGILVLIGLGIAGYIAFQVAPSIQAAIAETEQAMEELKQLDRQYPFEPVEGELDKERFAQVLDMRVTLRRSAQVWEEETEALGEAEEIGFIESIIGVVGQIQQLPRLVVGPLQEAGMSWREYSWHNRLMWAALETIDAGVDDGDERLLRLRGRYPELKGAWAMQTRQQDGAPDLSEVIGDFDPAVIERARAILATDVARVEEGFARMDVEVVYLSLGNDEMLRRNGLQVEASEPDEPAPVGTDEDG